MNEFKGTPGEWFIDQNNPDKAHSIYIETTHEATVLATLYCDPMSDEMRATAKLMCASKKMMEALQAISIYSGSLTYLVSEQLQNPDNCLKAIDGIKAALSAALD